MTIEMNSDSDILGRYDSLMLGSIDQPIFNADGRIITNVLNPTNASDVATKDYVDTSLAAKTEQFVVTARTENAITKSDKTLAEIMAAAGEGK